MSHNILVKLAPILDADRWDDPTWTRPAAPSTGPTRSGSYPESPHRSWSTTTWRG